MNFPAFVASTDSSFNEIHSLISVELGNDTLQVVYRRSITLDYIRNNNHSKSGPADLHTEWRRPYDFSRAAGCTLRNMIVLVTHEHQGNRPPLPRSSSPSKEKNEAAWKLGDPDGTYYPIFAGNDPPSKELEEEYFFAGVDKIFPHYEIEFRILRMRRVGHHQTYFEDKFYAASVAGDVIWHVVVGWELRLYNDEKLYRATPNIRFYILRPAIPSQATQKLVCLKSPPLTKQQLKEESAKHEADFTLLNEEMDKMGIAS